MYTSLEMNSLGAPLPTRSHTCSKAFDTHENRINNAIQMAPMGSRYQTNRSPTIDMTRPKMLTTISLRWSMKKTWTEGYFRRKKQ